MSYTLGDLRGEVRDICDISGSAFHNDYDLNKYINKSIAKLQTMVVNSFDSSLFVATGSFDITTVADTTDYDFSSLDPHKIVTVSLSDGSYDYTLKQAPWSSQHDFQKVTPINIYGDYASEYRYLLFGNRIKMIPSPPANYTIKLFHIPRWSNLTTDSDVIDSRLPENYMDYVIADVAIKIKIKSEEPVQELMAMRQDVERLIREDAENRITNQIKYAPDADAEFNRPWYWGEIF